MRDGSTVQAARRIGLSQPAVSAALGRLRNSLNDPLFVRHGQRLQATDYARSLALPLRQALESIETLIAGPPTFDPMQATETFKLSGSDFFAEMLMPALGEQCARIAPGIRLQLVDLVPGGFFETLAGEDVDLALIPQPTLPGWADWRPLFRSRLAMIARRDHPRLSRAGLQPGMAMPIDLFCALGHILFSPQGNFRAMGDTALSAAGRKWRVVMTVPVFYGVCSAVAESDHGALVQHQFAHRIATKLALDVYRPLLPMPLPLIGMIWHKRVSGAPAHVWLRDRIADLLEPLNDAEPPIDPTP
ncbi:LysR family transcriptional regulator [Sedimentitalea sp. HM32M-2]|uniref:LysR family transcriptional regulator n=1 Tax=Sedimentitalea sp. HM32M-2 TaxID=3351566 RepID=UPI003637DEC8